MFNALSAKYPWDEVLTETQISSLLYSPVNTYDKTCWFTDCVCSFPVGMYFIHNLCMGEICRRAGKQYIPLTTSNSGHN